MFGSWASGTVLTLLQTIKLQLRKYNLLKQARLAFGDADLSF